VGLRPLLMAVARPAQPLKLSPELSRLVITRAQRSRVPGREYDTSHFVAAIVNIVTLRQGVRREVHRHVSGIRLAGHISRLTGHFTRPISHVRLATGRFRRVTGHSGRLTGQFTRLISRVRLVTGHFQRMTGHIPRLISHIVVVTGHSGRLTGHFTRWIGHMCLVSGHTSRLTGHFRRSTGHVRMATGHFLLAGTLNGRPGCTSQSVRRWERL